MKEKFYFVSNNVVYTPPTRLDASNVPIIKDKLDYVLTNTPNLKTLIVDLENVELVTSCALALFVKINRCLINNGGNGVELLNASSSVRRTLRVAGLLSLLVLD